MHTFFAQLGLTKNEEEIYLFLLEYGSSIASIVAKRLNLNRVTAYASLRSLKRKMLVTSFEKNDVTYFEASTPEEIVHVCKKRVTIQENLEREAESLLPELKKIQDKQIKPILEVKGELKYYQGIDAVTALVKETLEEDQPEQLCFGLNKYHVEHSDDDWKTYTKHRVDKGMHVRSIQPDTLEAKEYKQRDNDELRTTILVPHKSFPADCELNIIGDMIALFVTHGDKPAGMKIYHKDMAKVLTSLFELACIGAKTFNKNDS
ncbi:hypothetical protein HOF56_04025 [Candidatus Peribacteria bacterium]|jgi:sugar-specific transcriptional regulator TrmB|nr:hypothetical protein [Candidatus Peribacteria bacterium]MBT4021552.1 hypothetical protein [Candidatus Peribacteria bacterium]MBT4240594.1 hypothetical protein [Candidatus Peribacteria bacterium]MBT4474671.1 hypothetical protein [Candidatus Peribacteria bacterium]